MTTSQADEPNGLILAAEARQLGRRNLFVAIVRMLGRLVAGFVVIVAMLALVPEQPEMTLVAPIVIALASTSLYVWFFVRQVQGVYRARYPMLRAMEALILVGAMFLAIFAMSYVMISTTDPSAFSEELDAFSAYYFALTVLATVGFGDITPSTTFARGVAMLQMALDIAFIAVLIRIMGGAAKRTIEEREARRSESEQPKVTGE